MASSPTPQTEAERQLRDLEECNEMLSSMNEHLGTLETRITQVGQTVEHSEFVLDVWLSVWLRMREKQAALLDRDVHAVEPTLPTDIASN